MIHYGVRWLEVYKEKIPSNDTQLEKTERAWQVFGSVYLEHLKVDAIAKYKLGNGHQIAFSLDTWESEIPLNILFPILYRVALLPKGLVADHWGSSLASSSIKLRHLLKEEEYLSSKSCSV